MSKRITEIIHLAKQTTIDLETNLESEVADLTKIIGETQNKLEVTMLSSRGEIIRTAVSPTKQIELVGSKPTLGYA